MLNHELAPSKRGSGRLGTHRAGTVRPGTGGGSREEPQEPSSQPMLTTLLAPGLRARGCGCARGSPPPSATLHGTRRLRAGRRHLQAPREHRGKVAALGASLQQDSSVLPLRLLATLGTQTEPELGTAAFGLISPVTPSQEHSAGTACDRLRVRPPRQSPAAGVGCGN